MSIWNLSAYHRGMIIGNQKQGVEKTRWFGSLEPWFDKTWRPGDIELMK